MMEKNNLVRKIVLFPQEGIKKIRNYEKYYDDLFIYEKIFKNGKKYGALNKQLIFLNNLNKYFMKSERVSPDMRQGDLHELSYLTKGKERSGIEYRTFWDGQKPKIHKYMNIKDNKELDDDLLEYLPLICASDNKTNISRKFVHIVKFMQKKFGLEKVAPKAIRVSKYKLDPMYDEKIKTNRRITFGNSDIFNGEINISKAILSDIELLKAVAHEFQHVKDFSDAMRIEGKRYRNTDKRKLSEIEECHPGMLRFLKRSLMLGEVTENSPEYDEIKKVYNNVHNRNDEYFTNHEEYSKHYLEQRAFATANKIKDEHNQVVNKLLSFLIDASS